MRVLWITGLPQQVQQEALGGEDHGAKHAASWITAHLPPPPGVELHLASLWPGGTHAKTVDYRGATFHIVPCPRFGRSATLFQLDSLFYKQLHRILSPDVVHGWGTEDSNGLAAVRLAPRRHVVGIQGVVNTINARVRPTLRGRLTAMTERMTLAEARHVVAESQFAANAASAHCRATKPMVVPQPVRAGMLSSVPGDVAVARAVFVGRVTEQKGIGDAISTFAQEAPPNWTLRIIGDGSAKERKELDRSLAASGLAARCTHVGQISEEEVVCELQRSAMLILPTVVDSGPTALKEALCMGLWPVCYDNTGPSELIRGFDYGTLATDMDRMDLSRCLRRIFAEEPWKDMPRRANCIARARAAFSPQQAWQHLTALYREIAD